LAEKNPRCVPQGQFQFIIQSQVFVDVRKRSEGFIPIAVHGVDFWEVEELLDHQTFLILARSALATGEGRPKLYIYLFDSEENLAF